VTGNRACSEGEFATRLLADDRAECAEPSKGRGHDARGVITGMLLGTSLWGAILSFVGVIKL
jgi:hypothetical protein